MCIAQPLTSRDPSVRRRSYFSPPRSSSQAISSCLQRFPAPKPLRMCGLFGQTRRPRAFRVGRLEDLLGLMGSFERPSVGIHASPVFVRRPKTEQPYPDQDEPQPRRGPPPLRTSRRVPLPRLASTRTRSALAHWLLRPVDHASNIGRHARRWPESHPGVSDGNKLMPSSQWGGVARAIPAR